VRIGELLKFYRQAKGKTQAVVAGLAGVTEDYLGQIERGLKTPTLPLVHRLSKILGVRVSDLLGESVTEHDEAVHPVGHEVQRALMAYAGVDDSPSLVALRERVNGQATDLDHDELRQAADIIRAIRALPFWTERAFMGGPGFRSVLSGYALDIASELDKRGRDKS
jgi:transcriptional regulator with XRE-family HTH domain